MLSFGHKGMSENWVFSFFPFKFWLNLLFFGGGREGEGYRITQVGPEVLSTRLPGSALSI